MGPDDSDLDRERRRAIGPQTGQSESMNWSRDALVKRGFTGFVQFADLQSAHVQTDPGVYVVLHPTSVEPSFIETSPAGWFRDKDPSVAVARVEARLDIRCRAGLYREGR